MIWGRTARGFQKAAGLVVDGIVGVRTREAMK